MPTHNHTRKPIHRAPAAIYCASCALTAQQVQILGEPTCCGSPFIQPSLASTPLTKMRRNLSLFPEQPSFKAQVARFPEDLPAPIPPYSTIIMAECDDCGGDGRNHHIDDDYEACEFCAGSGEQAVLRNWLGEAFQIENGMLAIEPRREHLTALKHYATQVVNVYNNDYAVEVA